MDDKMAKESEYTASCHCGKVKVKFHCSSEAITAWKCNCSDCNMRGNIHFMVPAKQMELPENLKENTILYEWGTKTAKRRFCATCGILPFYTPRSNPDGFGVTLACADFGENGPEIEIKEFDGTKWEESYKKTAIANETAAH